MSEAERRRLDDLAATSDSIREDARRIDRLEGEKQQLAPGDPRGDELSREVERLADAVEHKSRMERALHAADAEPDGGDPGRQRSN
jgi:hypothetical protein